MSQELPNRIADALARLAALARERENQDAQAETLSPLQSGVLVTLLRQGPKRVGSLAKELFVTYGTVSAAVTTLEEKGMVVKRPDPDEHRAVDVSLTPKGKHQAERSSGRGAAFFATVLDELDGAEAGQLMSALLTLIRAFERKGEIATTRMCLSCRHFVPFGGKGRSKGQQHHYCKLLEQSLQNTDLRIHCPEHEHVHATGSS